MKKSLVADAAAAWEADDGYPELETLLWRRLEVMDAAGPVLKTAAGDGLYEVFLNHIPGPRRQHYNCSACRKFVERYGPLVRVGDDGSVTTVLWEPGGAPTFFRDAVAAVRREVLKAKIDGVFLSPETLLGTPNAGGWSHFHGPNPKPFPKGVKTAEQVAAEKAEDYAVLSRSLAEFTPDQCAEAVRVLEADALDRGEKALGVARWFYNLRRVWAGPRKNNLAWRAVATAPPGWCHVRNSMIGTLLDDIKSGLGYDAVAARWAKKMHPLQYQRPTALRAGHLDRAEKLIKELGAETALSRRFATLADVVPLWRQRVPEAPPAGVGSVFGHLRAEAAGGAGPADPLALPPRTMTWEKFARDVLPGADRIEFYVPRSGAFYGLVTAADPEAKPIIQWDGEPRNPVSWYFYNGGSFAHDWGLVSGSWADVPVVMLKPNLWHRPDDFRHQGEGVMFVLAGARDRVKAGGMPGGGLFPELLKAEFHEIRPAVEAHAKAAVVAGADAGDANGYAVDKGNAGMSWDVRLRVTTGGKVSGYVLDRWD